MEKPRFPIHHRVMPTKKENKKQSASRHQSIDDPEYIIDELYKRQQLKLSCECKDSNYKIKRLNRVLSVVCRKCGCELRVTDLVFRQLKGDLQQIKRQEFEKAKDKKNK